MSNLNYGSNCNRTLYNMYVYLRFKINTGTRILQLWLETRAELFYLIHYGKKNSARFIL